MTMCDCLHLINEKLAAYNTAVSSTLALQNGALKMVGVRIETYKRDTTKRGTAMSLTASYCPFCGVKYETDLAYQEDDR